MDPSSLNILVEAKKEYLTQLYIVMCPTMIEVFEEMYKESVKVTKGRRTLIQYQKFLKEVVNWNDHMIHRHTETICNSCNWFNDLLAAVFVSTVKILSSVRLNAETNKISLKLPNNKVFIHGCFIAAAKDLYRNPYVYHEESIEQDRDTDLTNRFSKCIEETVKEMIPIQEILKSCMAQANKDTIDFENSPPEDTEDPDIMDEGSDEEEEEVPVIEEPAPMQQEQAPEPPSGSEPDPEVVETKNINLDGKQPPPEQDDSDVLFGDAPEAPQKENN